MIYAAPNPFTYATRSDSKPKLIDGAPLCPNER
jgi:hypothetical protein